MAEAAGKRAPARMTVTEFLDWEDGTDARFELLGGLPVAMAPSLEPHAEIEISLGAEIRARLKPPCRVLGNAGIRIPGRDDTFYVCDLVVTCSPRRPTSRYISEPRVLIEILPPSTSAHDRGTKASDYRRIASVQEIVLISASGPAAEVWRRSDRGWLVEDITGPDATLDLGSVGVQFPLGSLYQASTQESTPPARPRRRERR
jgi:Uma2 family endonuclease